MKAKETHWQGYRFRSRLEARWAVFFSHIGIKWEYEPEGFDVPGTDGYLLDFRINSGWGDDVWLEVKPNEKLSEKEITKAIGFQEMLNGQNWATPKQWAHYQILAGNPWPGEYTTMHVMQGSVRTCTELWTQCPLCNHIDLASDYCYGRDGVEESMQCMKCDCGDRNWVETDETWFHKGIVVTTRLGFIRQSPDLMEAYTAARSARFEFGDKPVTKARRKRGNLTGII